MAEPTNIAMHDTPAAEASASQPQPPLPASEKDLRWKRLQTRNPGVRLFLILGVVGLLVAVFFLWRYFASYENTDDAAIDGHLNSISARVSGHVARLLVQDNQYV